MVKMRQRNQQLKDAIGNMVPVSNIIESNNIPEENTTNTQGYAAYDLDDKLKLISMLNTIKLDNQFYRSESQIMSDMYHLIEKLALVNPYFVAQCIVYSRCIGEGMRAINHLAAALLSPFIAGKDFAKRFYASFNKQNKSGGCIYRPDDMSEIKDIFAALNSKNIPLSNAMKKGFKSVIESMDNYQLSKYKKTVIDISNLCHPNPKLSNATINVNGKTMKTIDALMKGITVSADTWEVAQSEAGQIVATAVKEGKLTKDDANKVLNQAKQENWKQLLIDNKLGILAALRNIRNILMTNPDTDTINALCALVSNSTALRNGKIMPHQIDIAIEAVKNEFGYNKYADQVINALIDGYTASIPNLKATLTGKTLVAIDCSGSMKWNECIAFNKNKSYNTIKSSSCDKAGLIAATIAKATDAQIIQFGSKSKFFDMENHKNLDVFSLGQLITKDNLGGTNIASVFKLIHQSNLKYDRIIILSDNEANMGTVSLTYKKYVHDVCSPYIYAVDLAAYGTTPIKGDKVNYYYGYGYTFFDDIASKEFNPMMHINKIEKIVI